MVANKQQQKYKIRISVTIFIKIEVIIFNKILPRDPLLRQSSWGANPPTSKLFGERALSPRSVSPLDVFYEFLKCPQNLACVRIACTNSEYAHCSWTQDSCRICFQSA